MDDDNVNNQDKKIKGINEDDEEELEEAADLRQSTGSSGSFLPDPDQIGSAAPAPKAEGAEFKSMPTVSSLPMTAPFAKPGGGGVYMAAPAVLPPPIQQPSVWDKHSDPFGGGSEPGLSPFEPTQVKLKEPPLPPQDWYLGDIECVPTYYPLEQSSKTFLIDHKNVTVNTITNSITKSLKVMSIQPKYIKDEASVALLTPENVEMYLCLWKTQDQGSIVVEIQRRRGCSIVFHKYCRHILDAAEGTFDGSDEFSHENDDVDFDSLKKAEKILLSEISAKSDGGKTDKEESVIAIEIVHGLVKSADRIDAQLLGMESLCILTNPRRTSIATSVMAGRAVLLGVGPEDNLKEQKIFKNTTFSDIRDFILTIILNRNLGDTGIVAAAEKMTIEYDSDDEDFFNDDADLDGFPPSMKDTMNVMLNHALTIVANSLEVLTNVDAMDTEPESTSKQSTSAIAKRFLQEANGIAASKGFKKNNMLLTLIAELGRAKSKTHNSCLAAKSLRHLCKASNDVFEEALKMNIKETGDKAYQVGREIHARLEKEIELFYKDHNQ